MVSVHMPSYCPTRWWSKWEVMKALLVAFGDVEDFLVKHHDISPTITSTLRKMLVDVNEKSKLKLELAAVVDAYCEGYLFIGRGWSFSKHAS